MKWWEQLLLNLANLFKVKAIISMVIVFIFAYKIFCGVDMGVEFFGMFTGVLMYWLCEKTKRKDDEE